MASIRKINVGTKDNPIIIEWNTGALNTLVFDMNEVRKVYDELVKPLFFMFRYKDRTLVAEMFRTIIQSTDSYRETGKMTDMNQFINLIMALRLTTIGSDIWFGELYSDDSIDMNKILFWNIAWDLNHTPNRLDTYLYVQAYDYNGVKVFMSFMNAEAYDRPVRFDVSYKKSWPENKEIEKKIKEKKKSK